MSCERILARAADLSADDDAEVAAHLATCAACRATLDDARDAAAALAAFERDATSKESLPPADVQRAWAAAHPPPSRTALRTLARAAAVVLAAVGVFALAGARVEAAGDRVAFVLAPSWAAAPASVGQQQDAGAETRLVAAIARVHGDVAGRFDDVCRRFDEREAALGQRLDDALAAFAAQDEAAVRAIVSELETQRREIATLRWHQLATADAGGGAPPLPAPSR